MIVRVVTAHCVATEITDDVAIGFQMGNPKTDLRFWVLLFCRWRGGVVVMRKLPQQVICDHCGYITQTETKRLGEVGDEGSWVCPACSICNTSYHKSEGYVTVLGYQRDLEIGYL